MRPFPHIPEVAVPFFQDDSDSRMVGVGGDGTHPPWAYHTGVFGNNVSINAGQTVTAWVTGGELFVVPQPGFTTMFNVDFQLELCDISGGTLKPTGIVLTHALPYNNDPSGQLMSVVVSPQFCKEAKRPFGKDTPMAFAARAPATGGPFQISPVLFFNSGITVPWLCNYAFYIQGAWQAQ
jgi:hypothetical protein